MKNNLQIKKVFTYSILAMSLLSLYGVFDINSVIAAPLINPPNVPLEGDNVAGAKPNIMLLIDDSGSMLYDYLGDEVVSQKNCKSYDRLKDDITNFSSSCTSKENDSSPVLGNKAGDVPFYAYDFNKIYYNPNVIYEPGVDYLGNSLGNQSMTSARKNIYFDNETINLENGGVEEIYYCIKTNVTKAELLNKDICKINGIDTPGGLGVAFNYYRDAFPDINFKYKKNGPLIPGYYEMVATEYCDSALVNCDANIGRYSVPAKIRWCKEESYAVSGSVVSGKYTTANNRNQNICQKAYDKENGYVYARFSNFKRVSLKENEKTNFANWFTYYRSRINSTKTALGLSLRDLDANKRIGLVTINPMNGSNIDNNKFLKIDDFDNNHKQNIYSKIYNLRPSGGTYLMEALSRVGRYYAGKNDGINQGMIPTLADDPVQYSCQQNYTILATDGYWNQRAGKKINNENIANEDNVNEGYSTRASGSYDGNLPGASGTLADVAMYYYKTDLRPEGTLGGLGLDVSGNNVPITSGDKNTKQHMVTYGLSFGLNGFMDYTKDYYKGTSADLENIKSGVSGVCSWTTGVCNWPVPKDGSLSTIDDLWHATINGRGKYYSAQNPQDVIYGLQDAFNSLSSQLGTANRVTTSSPNISQSNNKIFYSTYRTGHWDGDITAKRIDPNTGIIDNNTLWSARDNFNNMVSPTSDTRTIYYSDARNPTNKTRLFTWENLSDSDRSMFTNRCSRMSSCSSLTAAEKAKVNNGENMVNWIRGQSSNEDVLREREFVLGDIINSSPIYVDKPKYNWSDEGYEEFKNQHKDRKAMLYVGANDGMIHAIDPETGESVWSLIPKQVMENLYKLADKNYSANHNFYVNGQLTSMDVKIGNDWKTVLVGAMERGGEGYIAIDITNPEVPNVLWELCAFQECTNNDSHIGKTYGNPIITKRDYDNKFVTYLTSGYDNAAGNGVVYEVDIANGRILFKHEVQKGSSDAQLGFSKINAVYDNFQLNNAAKYLYLGDLNGKVWKLDIKDKRFTELGVALDSANNPQPITTKIEIGKINNKNVLFFGTGQYLNGNDLINQNIQSFYAIKDTDSNTTPYGVFRTNPTLVEQTITATENATSVSGNEIVDWDMNNGWWFDFTSESGERMNIDPVLTMGTLNIITNVPASSMCNAGGNSWYYQIDYRTGGSINKGGNVVGQKMTSGLSTGQNIIMLEGSGGLQNFITDAAGNVELLSVMTNSSSNRRKVSSWKEILKQK